MSENKLTIAAKSTTALSKQQQQFNKLVKEIEGLKVKRKTLEKDFNDVKSRFAKSLLPLVDQARDLTIQTIFALDFGYDNHKIAKKYKEAISFQIQEMLDSLIPVLDETGEDTSELKRIYEKHSEIDFDEQKQGMDDVATEMFESIFGIKVDPTRMKDGDYMEELQKEFDAKNEPKERKKTKKQLEKEQKEKEAQAQLGKDTKSIYTTLAKQLHPDLEQDESLKEQKTELMKRVTQAYSENDLYELLQIQMEVEQLDADALANVSDNLMGSYIAVLKKQIAAMRNAINEEFRANPVFQMVFDYNDKFSESKFRKQVKDLKESIKVNEDLIKMTKNKDTFLSFAKDAYEEQNEADDFGSFLNFFGK